jgi:TRAP-type mannitol/chloroaromatic compound transport system permease large subunit
VTWALPYEWLAPLMFGTLLVLLFTGYPVAFSLGGTALIFAGIAMANGLMDPHFLLLLPDRIFGFMSNSVLLSIPFFIFMGNVLEKSRLAEDLLTTIGAIFGAMRGGLALAVVLVGTLLAAATGVVGASVVAMGMISLPVMLRYGYSKSLACGVIAAVMIASVTFLSFMFVAFVRSNRFGRVRPAGLARPHLPLTSQVR